MDHYIIGMDIGGTSIKAGLINSDLNLLYDRITEYAAKADQGANDIVDNIVNIVADQTQKLSNGFIQGVGMAFPGPFDYQKGISYMQNIGKFDAIYGLDLPSLLRQRIIEKNLNRFIDNYALLFANDAVLFALGEYYKGKASGFQRVLCVTLGTGCGSAFLKQGKRIKGTDGVSENGFIFDQPYGDSIVDDYISRRGILRIAERYGFDTITQDVKEFTKLAREGNKAAREMFVEFGMMLGEVLEPHMTAFGPEIIVLGGQISNAFDLFGEALNRRICHFNCGIRVSENTSKSALIGAASMIVINSGIGTIVL